MNTRKKLVDTMTWAASSEQQVDLPTAGLITDIDLELSLTLSGSGASALAALGIWRTIQSLRIEGGSGRVYYGMSGTQMGMLMHFMNMVDFPGTTWHEIIATTQSLGWKIHFGSRPRDMFGRYNPSDLTAAIPAMTESKPKLIWTTTAANALDASVTISSATMRVFVTEVLDGYKAWDAQGRMMPISSSESYDPGATKSDLQGQRDIPTGKFIRRIGIMALDATAQSSAGPLLKDDQMTEVGIFDSKKNRWLMTARQQALAFGNPLIDGGQVATTPNTLSPHNPGGLWLVDMRQFDHPDFGLDTRGSQLGDWKLAMTIGAYSSAEKEHIFYDMVEQYNG